MGGNKSSNFKFKAFDDENDYDWDFDYADEESDDKYDDELELDELEELEFDYFGKSNYKNSRCDESETDEDDYEASKNKHGISILMNVNSNDAGVIRDALTKAGHVRLAEDFETRRELGIMHELKEKGLAATLECWSKDNYGGNIKKPRYKMKHKTLAK